MTTVAEIIQEHEAHIMEQWLADARAQASAHGLSAAALENVMPMFLMSLGIPVVNDAEQRARHVQNHISSRLRQGFELAEIVREFVMIERRIAAMWAHLPENQWPAPHDIDRLHDRIHRAITDVTETFHHHLLADEQADKRSARRLQDIASKALHDVTVPLRERLGDLLDVIREAMQAQTAVLLLHEQSELVLAGSAGDVAIEPETVPIDESSFAGMIAAHEEPVMLYDVATTKLVIPEPLRASNVRGLLGVRLPPRYDLVGVVYIGIAAERTFTARESRRLELLGERLALHIENARLFDELHDKIETLGVEKALREQFVSTLAHDLRGPLSSARLAAELMAANPVTPDEHRQLANRIDRNIERVDRMIRDLLDANRIRAGEPLPLRIEPCDLTELVEHVVSESRSMFGDRFVVIAPRPVHGFWSKDELHRAMWNLITNAAKYGTPRASIEIIVEQDDALARISVHNVGTPIPLAEQEYIFNAYARAKAHAGGRTGWGLGLTLVRGAAEAHGGRVSVHSAAGLGTTFTIEVPLDARTARQNVTHVSTTVH